MDLIRRIRHRLPPVSTPIPDAKETRVSSVLIAVGHHATTGREEILLTKRTMWVETHKGQVSFPGGFREARDTSLVETALRESEEEIGTRRADIEILGGLPPVRTHQGVPIYPWVGALAFPYPFALNSAEVEKVLFLPLAQLLEEGLRPVTVQVGKTRVQSTGITAEGELVWGATARILEELRGRLLASP